MDEATKHCVLCSTDRPITEFHKDKMSKDGTKKYCKVCMKMINKQNYEKRKAKEVAAATTTEQ